MRGPFIQAGFRGEVLELPVGPQKEAGKTITGPTSPAGVGPGLGEGAARGGGAVTGRGRVRVIENSIPTNRTGLLGVLCFCPIRKFCVAGLGALPPGRTLMEQPPGLSPEQKNPPQMWVFLGLRECVPGVPPGKRDAPFGPQESVPGTHGLDLWALSPQKTMFLTVQPCF